MGFQIGASSTDLIMLVMSERGADKLLSSKFTLGAEGSVAAGPVGRTATAQTDVQMRADILSWSRSQGLFVGLALEGGTHGVDAVIGVGGNFAITQQVMLGAGDGGAHWTVSLPFVSAPSWRGADR